MDEHDSNSPPAPLHYADPGTKNAEDTSDSGSAMIVGGLVGLIVANVVLFLWLKYTPTRSMDDSLGKGIVVALLFPFVWPVGIGIGVLTVFLYRRFR